MRHSRVLEPFLRRILRTAEEPCRREEGCFHSALKRECEKLPERLTFLGANQIMGVRAAGKASRFRDDKSDAHRRVDGRVWDLQSGIWQLSRCHLLPTDSDGHRK
jgi:hypothetical protein